MQNLTDLVLINNIINRNITCTLFATVDLLTNLSN